MPDEQKKHPPTYFQLSIKPGASVKTTTPLSAEELRKLIWEAGGIARTGVLSIPVVPNPGNKSETFYVLRADVISVLIIEPLAEEEKGKIIIPELQVPKDILTPGK
jgi:hypothetical protein